MHSPFTLGRAGLAYAKKHHVPCIATMHSQFKQDFQRAVKSDILATKLNNNLMKFFNKCDECWAVNSEVARIYYEDYHYRHPLFYFYVLHQHNEGRYNIYNQEHTY